MNIDNLPDPSSDLAFVKPGYVFRGIPLNPAGAAIRTLWQQAIINDSGDSNSASYISWALVFLLTLDRKKAKELAFNRSQFRSELLDWQDQFVGVSAANDEARAIFDRVWADWDESKIEVQGDSTAVDPNA